MFGPHSAARGLRPPYGIRHDPLKVGDGMDNLEYELIDALTKIKYEPAQREQRTRILSNRIYSSPGRHAELVKLCVVALDWVKGASESEATSCIHSIISDINAADPSAYDEAQRLVRERSSASRGPTSTSMLSDASKRQMLFVVLCVVLVIIVVAMLK